MKCKKLISCLCAVLIAFLLGFGGAACMVTGLNLPANLGLLALGCGAGALIAGVCFSIRRGGLILGGIAVLHCLLMALSQNFHTQLQALGYSAFQYYNRAYGLPIPEWFNGHTASSQLLPLFLIAGLVMTAAAWTVARRKRAILTVLLSMFPLASCLVVTDTVPDPLPIFLLVAGLVLLMMSQSTRRQDEIQGNRLTAILAVPVFAAVAILFLMIPQGDYSAPETLGSIQDVFDWFVQKIPEVGQTSQGELVISIGGNAKQEVDLTHTGRRIERNTPVMEVDTDYTGRLYLRGRDYDVYTGHGWKATQSRIEDGYGPTSVWYKDTHTASIQILGRRGQYYLPCYPAQQQTLIGGMLPNPDYIKSYTYEFSPLRSDWQVLWHSYQLGMMVADPLPTPDSRYLELPEATRQRAQTLLETVLVSNDSNPAFNGGSHPVLSKAAQIEAYVKNSAVYDLNPGRMPGSEDDFALWFLEDSDKGYCVHFATAATVLLRAAGIPARYVEGYTVPTTGGETTIVRDKQAHAWVEYHLDHVGWVILDPTPASTEPEPSTTPTDPPETTAPSTTRPAETVPNVTEPSVPASTEQGQTSGTSDTQFIDLPGNDTGSPPVVRLIPQWFLSLLTVLLWTAAITLLIIGQWLLRRHLKLKYLHQGRPNLQALNRYRETRRLARLSGLPLPDDLTVLAQKAKFSQHVLTTEELGQFDAYISECTQTLREKPWYYRLVCRVIFAAY